MDLLSWNPCQVMEVSRSEYSFGGKPRLREEGGLALHRNPSCQTWDCVLQCPETPAVALRLFQTPSEEDAQNWFLKLCPLLELAHPQFNAKTLQTIMDCLQNHPDWSWARIAVETGISGMNCKDGARQTALHLACEKGDLDCVRELLQEYGGSTDVRNHNGDTPFHCAAKQDSAAIIQELCSRSSAGVNELNNVGETPLHVASQFGMVESLKALLESGAKCDVIGAKAYPIHTAMKYSRRRCAEAILEADPAQLQSKDPVYGGIPLHWAKTVEMTKILLEKGSWMDFQSKTGQSPLIIHTKKRRFDSVIDLLSGGADINLRGLNGNTALHYAMKMDHMEMIKALIVFGANVEIPNDLGETPKIIAEQTSKEHLDIVCVAYSSKVETEPRTEVGEDVDSNAGSKRIDRLLSLDGGGIRGLILVEILTVLEREAGRPVRELFDWISGTSTGGILALAIVHGKSMEYLRRLYFRLKGDVFKGSRPYDSGPLEKLLKEEFGENTNMNDVKHPRVIVTSVLADRKPPELHIFRNYTHPFKVVRRHAATFHSASTATLSDPVTLRERVWYAARATSAAPTYFRPMDHFMDGGVLANNPTLDSMAEIQRYNKALRDQGRGSEAQRLGVVVSLGTGKIPQSKVPSVDVYEPKNFLETLEMIKRAHGIFTVLLNSLTMSDSCIVDRARSWCEMADTSYHRLNPQLSKEVDLNETDNKILVNILWETWEYLYKHKEDMQALAKQLRQD